MNPWLADITPPKRENIVIDADFDGVDDNTKQAITGLLDYSFNTYGYNPAITSGYRDPERNARANGAPNSWHLQGKAVDLDLSGLTPEQLADVEAKAREKFSEVLYHDAGSGMHLHAANPIQQERNIVDKLLFSQAEASPTPVSGNPWLANETPQPVVASNSSNPWLQSESVAPTTFSAPVQPTPTVEVNGANIPALFDEMGNPNINTEGSGLGKVVNDYFAQPVANAVGTTLEYLDKPRGAIAGGVNALIDQTSLTEGIKKGWQENTSWKETLPKSMHDTLAGQVTGLAMDIALDPLWLATPAKAVSIVKRAGKALNADKAVAPIVTALEKAKNSEQVQSILNKEFELPGWGNITVKRALSEKGPIDDLLDKLKIDKAKLNDQVAEASKPLDALDVKQRENVTRMIEANPEINTAVKPVLPKAESDTISTTTKPQLIEKMTAEGFNPEQIKQVETVADSLSNFSKGRSKELLDRNIISQETYDKYYGRYIRREYLKHENPLEFAKQLREAGNVAEAEKIEKAAESIANNRFKKSGVKMNWDDIKQRKDLSEAEQEALGRIMDASHPFAKGGQVSSDLIAKYDFLEGVKTQFGNAVEQPGYRLIEGKGYGPLSGTWVPKEVYNEVVKTVSSFSKPETLWRQAVSWWKMGKTILNPAGHARNFMSNAILLDIGGVPAAKVPVYLTRAAKEMLEKGKYYQEAKANTTILLDTFKQAEALQLNKPGVVKSVIDKAGDVYQKNEEMGKMAAYMYARETGKDIAQAAKFANDTLFDYGKVPPVIDYLRRSGLVPFASFPYFATKATAKSLYRQPMDVLKYYKPNVAGKTDEQKAQEKLYPKWMQPQNYLPLGKSTRMKNGKQETVDQFLDTSFIFPFDNDVSISPAFTLAASLATNKNWLTGSDIARKGQLPTEKANEYFKYAAQQLLPSFAPYGYSVDKLSMAFKGEMDKQGRQYTPQEAILHTIFGLKNVPINTDEMAKKAFHGIRRDAKDVKLTMGDVMRDKSLSNEQKKTKLNDYRNSLKQLSEQAATLRKAYKDVKGKEID